MFPFYEGDVYRPPSEANSLIIQDTIGCSHNRCTFCTMYRDKRFRIRPVTDVLADLDAARPWAGPAPRLFLADGDALIRRTEQQLEILSHIRKTYPDCQRVTCYASPESILTKTPDELTALRKAGLTMVYLGLESGSDTVLRQVEKGVTTEEMIRCAHAVHEAGIELSVTAISGLGGQALWREHAEQTGRVLSAMHPEYIGLLTLMFHPGTPMTVARDSGMFQPLSPMEVLDETRLLLQNLSSPGSVFRSNHASNYLNLRGTLDEDIPALLDLLEKARAGLLHLRSEQYRAL